MMNRRWWVVVGVALLVCLFGTGRIFAQEVDSPFVYRARLLQVMDNNPERVVVALEQVLSAEQAAALEALLWVAPDDGDKVNALEAAKRRLLEAGLEASDTLVLEVEARIALLVPTEVKPN